MVRGVGLRLGVSRLGIVLGRGRLVPRVLVVGRNMTIGRLGRLSIPGRGGMGGSKSPVCVRLYRVLSLVPLRCSVITLCL